MPIYEYQCPKCRKVFEEFVSMADGHSQEPCPECGTTSPRLISHTSFVLKGGGWYVTDYGYRKGVKEEADAPAAPPEGSSSDTPSDAPPEAPKASPPSDRNSPGTARKNGGRTRGSDSKNAASSKKNGGKA